jgi:methylthioribose-1-phosphate isomerase
MIPTIEWIESHVRMVDQRKLPSRIEWVTCKTHRDVIRAIEKMVIRGAPAIGVAAAMGLALGAGTVRTMDYGRFLDRFREMGREMVRARPTAVNLRWAVERMVRLVEQMKGQPVEAIKVALREESQEILDDDIRINRRIGQYGQTLVPKGATILTHCNAGSLATGGYGTALGVIRAAHENGKEIQVIADETRPWLQGLRITAFELMGEGIPVFVIADSAAGSLMRMKRVHLVITGADRIAANGDVANKIGTYSVAVLAKENGVPFYVAAPLSTIDPSIEGGDSIPIEERDPGEICRLGRTSLGPVGVCALNPAFDITPAKYVSGIITEVGIIKEPYREGIERALKSGRAII